LSVILGVTGIPLAYIVRNEEEPDDEAEYVNFNERMIA
jgi:DMSO/TMAO reductase YedYZ molybdopterin-dependent catalytic subunit